ncbi:MAG: transposase [Opitutales bacterium]
MPRGDVGVYHVISRAAFGQAVFDRRGKEVFVRMLRRQAVFSGVDILTFCVMDNHFHLLVRVGGEDLQSLSDREIARRYRALYGHCQEMHPGQLHPNDVDSILQIDGERAVGLRTKLKRRMGDLSCFVQELKLRYARWYNHKYGNRGSIWAARYKSVMVEPKGPAVEVLATYIDLNPVRAGIVEDPAHYRWSGYGEAAAGVLSARKGLELVMNNQPGDFMAAYREKLGVVARFCTRGDKSRMSQEVFEKIRNTQGQLNERELLSLKVRYFADGFILGSERFLGEQRDRLGLRRSKEALGVGLLDGVCSFRCLRKDIVS